jgi:3-oxoacyl-[acyl-carrier-protein] synthase-3
MGTRIASIGYVLPPLRVSNDTWREQFASKVELSSNEFSRFISDGIEQRYYWKEGTRVADVGAQVALDCLSRVDFSPKKVEHIILLTNVSDTFINGEAPRVQALIGASGCSTFDLTGVACSGFLIALNAANALIVSGSVNNVLIVCVANPASRAADHRDVSACSFGDLATAVLLERTNDDAGLRGYCHKTRGEYCDLLGHGFVPDGKRTWPSESDQPWARHFFYVDPREGVVTARRGAEEYLPESGRIALEKAAMTPDNIRWFVTHQPGTAPMRIWDRALGFDPSKHPNTIAEIANCSFATIPFTLRRILDRGDIRKGDDLLLLAPGSGQHAVSAVWRW